MNFKLACREAYRHLSLYDVNKDLPKAPGRTSTFQSLSEPLGGNVALPEGAFWLLVTGEEPDAADVKGLTEESRGIAWPREGRYMP